VANRRVSVTPDPLGGSGSWMEGRHP
jgi:hypothetical protein